MGGRAGSGTGGAATTGGAAGASGAAGAGGAPNAALVPAQGALLGEYYGDGTVAQTDMRIGRKPAVHLTYFAWEDDWTRAAQRDLDDGRIPLVNWEPAGIDFNDIVAGTLDDTIKARATGSKNIGKPFFLDFAAEMNGDEGWGGNNAPLYVSAYRHMHDLFVAAGATNVVWAWCPNVTDINGGNRNTLDYYPGDAYVDWTGVDGYNWGSGGGFAWQSFHDVFARIYPILATKGKPILIGEMASDENGGDKGAWIDAILPTLKNDFPMIKGLVWFDVHKERNWQINSSPASLAAYQRFAQDPYMN
jgi:endoglucanase